MQPLDYFFFFMIVMLASYFGYQYYVEYVRVNENADDGKLLQKYILLETIKVERSKRG